MGQYFLTLDCGLTNTKAVLFDSAGGNFGTEKFSTPLEGYRINTAVLRKCIIRSIQSLLAKSGLRGEEVRAVSVCGHGNGCYFLTDEGIHEYGFSSMLPESAPFAVQTEETFAITGQTSWNGQPLAILSWLKRTCPDWYSKIRKILFCKDCVRYFLTEKAMSDYTDASASGLLNYRLMNYSKQLLQIYDLEEAEAFFPRLLPYTDTAGEITKEFSEESGLKQGTPVYTGLFDVNSCLLGSGILQPGVYGIIAGTWGIHAGLTNDWIIDPSITQSCAYLTPDRPMCIDSAPTSCANLTWFLNHERKNPGMEEINRIVSDTKREPGLFYLPYRYRPMDLPDARAGFIGMTARHTFADRLRAVYEGILFEHRRRAEKLQRLGICYSEAVLSGGASRSRVFSQMFSDISGLMIRVMEEMEAGAFGQAVLCAAASGCYSNTEQAAGRMVREKEKFLPHSDSYYEEKYAGFLALLENCEREGSQE